jgi:hypothetical protein
MAVELLEPVNAPVLSPAQKKADTPTHAPIPIVRIARSIADRAPEATPDLSAIASAESIQPDQEPIPSPPPTLARPRLRPRPTLQPRFKTEHDVARTIDSQDAVGEMPAGVPVPVAPQYAAFHLSAPAPANEVEEFGFPESPATWSNLRARRRARFLRFVVWEVFALTITGLAGVVVLVHRPPDDALALTARIVTIAFAIAAATIPVVFYGLPETLPESDR